jgi:hypothetical protein
MKRKSLKPIKRITKTVVNWSGYCSECEFWELRESLQSIEDKIRELFNVGGYDIIPELDHKIPKVRLEDCYCHKFKILRSMEATPCMLYQYIDRGKIDLLPKLFIARQKKGEKSYA